MRVSQNYSHGKRLHVKGRWGISFAPSPIPLIRLIIRNVKTYIVAAYTFLIMKIIGLAGSPRGKNSITLKLVEAGVKGAADEGADCGLIDIATARIFRCKGCGECYRTGRCAQGDDLDYVLECMLAADGVILGSPAYAGGVTSMVECLMERMGDVIHCRRLEGKYGFSITASHNGDEGFVAAGINGFLEDCGVATIGSVGVDAGSKKSVDTGIEQARKLGRSLVEAIREQRPCPSHEESRARFIRKFGAAVRGNSKTWAHDYQYWRVKGWL